MTAPTDRLAQLLERSWDLHRGAVAGGLSVIADSIPVLWFGDSARYFASSLRVVTVAKNPASGEFPESDRGLRFPRPVGSGALGAVEHARALDEYFRRAPYWNWFRRLEPLLAGFGASQVPGPGVSGSLHLDLYTPLATDPTWGGLSDTAKALLRRDGVPLWNDLVRCLCPHVVLLAAGPNQRSHLDGSWTDGPREIPEWTGNKAVSWGRFRFGSDCEPVVVLGVNMRGHPFGALSYAERRRVADLVGHGGNEAKQATSGQPPPPPSSTSRPLSGIRARHELHESIGDLAEQLREWLAANDGSYDEDLRLDGVSGNGKGGGQPWIGWKAAGFLEEDYVGEGIDGTAFNRVFCLAGDTRRSAVQAFVDAYDERGGDPRAIFQCDRARPRNGVSSSLKLKLRPEVQYWQCLGSEDREAQIRKKTGVLP